MLRQEFGVSRRQGYRYLAIARAKAGAAFAGQSPDEIRARIEAFTFDAITSAQVPNAMTGQPNAAAMVGAIRTYGDLTAVMSAKRVDVTMRAAPKDLIDAAAAIVGEIVGDDDASADGEAGGEDSSGAAEDRAGAGGDTVE